MLENMDDYARASLELATAHICQSLGWHSVHRSSHNILTDVLERYLKNLTKKASDISNHSLRTIPNLNDVALAFDQLGIYVHELEDYVHQVEQNAPLYLLPKIPLCGKENLLQFSEDDCYPPFVEIESPATIIKTADVLQEQMPMEEEESLTEKSDSQEYPKDLAIKNENIDSPPYSPLEPKCLNIGAQENIDLTRPGLKVSAPKGYTPTQTSKSSVPDVNTVIDVMHQDKTTILSPIKFPGAKVLSPPKDKRDNINNKTIKTESTPDPLPNKPSNLEKSVSMKTKHLALDFSIKVEPLKLTPIKNNKIVTPPKPITIMSKNNTSAPRSSKTILSPKIKTLSMPIDIMTKTFSKSAKVDKPCSKISDNIKSAGKVKETQRANRQLPEITLKMPDKGQICSPPDTTDTNNKVIIESAKSINKGNDCVTNTNETPGFFKGKSKTSESKKMPNKILQVKIEKDENEPELNKSIKIKEVQNETAIAKDHKDNIYESEKHKNKEEKLELQKVVITKKEKVQTSIEPSKVLQKNILNEINIHEKYEQHHMEVDQVEKTREIPDSPPPLTMAPHVILSPVSMKAEPDFDASQNLTEHSHNTEIKKPDTPSRAVIFHPTKDSLLSPKVELTPPNLFDASVVSRSPNNINKTSRMDSEDNDENPIPMLISPVPTKMPVLTFQKQTNDYEDTTSKSTASSKKNNYIEEIKEEMVDVESETTIDIKLKIGTTVDEDKKRKKKKKSEKDKEEKVKKSDIPKEKKDKKKKRDEKDHVPIPKLTLKMGGETISEPSVPKLSIRSAKSLSLNTALFDLPEPSHAPAPTPLILKSIVKKTKSSKPKKNDKEKETEKEKEVKSGGFYVETLKNTSTALGGEVYYCPGCGLPDDGSPMIGCDSCDLWYHWPCVEITVAPADDEQWYCPKCLPGAPPAKRKKKKKRKKDP